MTGTASVLRADARNLPLPDESVDLVVTSPPYFALRSYTDDGRTYGGQVGAETSPCAYVAALLDATREMVRALKPTGSIFVDLGDKYARAGGGGAGSSDGRTGRGPRPASSAPEGVPEKSLMLLPERYRIAAVDELGLIARAVIVWSKPNGLPESVTDRVRRSHEDWVHLTRQPRYYSAVDEIRQPHAAGTVRRAAQGFRTNARHDSGNSAGSLRTDGLADGYEPNPLGALPGSVWTIPTEPLRVPDWLDVDHFAAFPTEWPRRLIAAFCPEGGTVLDPFGGTGTTALAAKATGRYGVTADLSTDYCRLAAWRVADPEQVGKVRGRYYADRQGTLDEVME